MRQDAAIFVRCVRHVTAWATKLRQMVRKATASSSAYMLHKVCSGLLRAVVSASSHMRLASDPRPGLQLTAHDESSSLTTK